MTANTADAVIIGGGVAGISTLYHLAKRGLKAILFETNRLGSGTTAYTAGWVMLQESTKLQILMSKVSLDEFLVFQDEMDIGLRKKGLLSVNTVEYIDTERKRAKMQMSLGVPTVILSSDDIKKLVPFLNVKDIGIGRYCEDDGIIDAHALIQRYAKKSRELGSVIYEGVQVTGILKEKDRVVGVCTSAGTVSTPIVINAAGIRAKQIAGWVGIELPIHLDLRHNVYTDKVPSIPRNMPLLEILNPVVIYLGATEQRADYTVGSFSPGGFTHRPNLHLLLDTHYADLEYRMPDIAHAGIMKCTAGIRAHSPDGLPILGPIEEIEGYYNNCGWGGHGVMHSPIGGQLVASYITGVDTPSVSIEPFLFSRFAASQTNGHS